MKAKFVKRDLVFKKPAGTSRGVLTTKPSWFLFLEENAIMGIGEASLIPGLSRDTENEMDHQLAIICDQINSGQWNFAQPVTGFPSISFCLEMALLDFECGGKKILFPSDFTRGERGLRTNGLIWMGDAGEMMGQIRKKLEKGFRCLKMKIGAMEIEMEMDLLRQIRKKYAVSDLEIRVDANGAFTKEEAYELLPRLKQLSIHSIEQPIAAGNLQDMADLCKFSPVPIALDEEMIGEFSGAEKEKLIDTIRPQYLVLKPSLLGGFKESESWIKAAESYGVGWWVTSALESNIGLNAIAQWVATLTTNRYQGLGIGNLYERNIECPLFLSGEALFYDPSRPWNLEFIL